MPGASDAYVATFRQWLEKIGGGGPFGPQNAAWLAAAGPRLAPSQLLEHYHSHTEKCSICSKALARIKVLKAVARALAVVGGVTALAAAVSQAVVAQESFVTAFFSRSSFATLYVIGGVVLAAVFGAVWRWCNKTIPRFIQGEHPPARNRVAGEFTP